MIMEEIMSVSTKDTALNTASAVAAVGTAAGAAAPAVLNQFNYDKAKDAKISEPAILFKELVEIITTQYNTVVSANMIEARKDAVKHVLSEGEASSIIYDNPNNALEISCQKDDEQLSVGKELALVNEALGRIDDILLGQVLEKYKVAGVELVKPILKMLRPDLEAAVGSVEDQEKRCERRMEEITQYLVKIYKLEPEVIKKALEPTTPENATQAMKPIG